MRPWSMLLLLTGHTFTPPARAQEPITAFVNVSVIPMARERVLTGQTVVVQGSRIVALGAVTQVPVPGGARRIDGRGKFLMPGLSNMHSHFRPDTTGLFSYVANGITTLRDPGQAGDDVLAFRALVTAHRLLAPQLYLGSGYDGSSPAAAAQSVVTAKAKGYDNVKLARSEIPLDVYDSIVAAVVTHKDGYRILFKRFSRTFGAVGRRYRTQCRWYVTASLGAGRARGGRARVAAAVGSRPGHT